MAITSSASPVIVALDFETANYSASSACQLGLVRIENWQITHKASWMIQPPTSDFVFTYIHGIAWEHVEDSPSLAGHWPEISALLDGGDYFAAHNAPFDRGVLAASCRIHGFEPPATPFIDTVKVARTTWAIFPTKLNHVCSRLDIQLQHHEALSDANACAEILLKAATLGWRP